MAQQRLLRAQRESTRAQQQLIDAENEKLRIRDAGVLDGVNGRPMSQHHESDVHYREGYANGLQLRRHMQLAMREHSPRGVH